MAEGGRHNAARADAGAWFAERTTRSRESDLEEAVGLLSGRTVSVVVPARNEAATVGGLVGVFVRCLRDRYGLVNEVVVVDDGSTDSTARHASSAGARVVTERDVRGDVAPAGKGAAMWRGLAATSGDLVLFVDADVDGFPPHWAASLLLPLLRGPDVSLVKAAYDRPLHTGGVAHPGSGGRVTRLLAVPLLNALAPELAVFAQPLAGETAARRSLLEGLPFRAGYGVELQLLLDAHATVGLAGLAQVDLGVRVHRHQSDEALGAMAATLAQVAVRWCYGEEAGPGTYRRARRGGRGALELADDDLLLGLLPALRALPGPPGDRPPPRA